MLAIRPGDPQQPWYRRWQALLPPHSARDLVDYDRMLCELPHVTPWQPPSLLAAAMDQAAARPGDALVAADLGAGAAVAATRLGTELRRRGQAAWVVAVDGHYAPRHPQDGVPFDRGQFLAYVGGEYGAKLAPPDAGPVQLPVLLGVNWELDGWPFEAQSLNLIVSRCALMYCGDKFAVLENAYRSLKPGGIALLCFDQRLPDRRGLRRITLPDGLTLETLMAARRTEGYEIHALDTADSGYCAVIMRRTLAADLRFGLSLAAVAKESAATTPDGVYWGCHSRYRHAP